jgi:hypothetical protein
MISRRSGAGQNTCAVAQVGAVAQVSAHAQLRRSGQVVLSCRRHEGLGHIVKMAPDVHELRCRAPRRKIAGQGEELRHSLRTAFRAKFLN